jgi:hypothetical protein
VYNLYTGDVPGNPRKDRDMVLTHEELLHIYDALGRSVASIEEELDPLNEPLYTKEERDDLQSEKTALLGIRLKIEKHLFDKKG